MGKQNSGNPITPERGTIEDARPPEGPGMSHKRHVGMVRNNNGKFYFFWDKNNLGITKGNIGNEIEFEIEGTRIIFAGKKCEDIPPEEEEKLKPEKLCFDLAVPIKLYDVTLPILSGVIIKADDLPDVDLVPETYGYLRDRNSQQRVYYWNKNEILISFGDEVIYEYQVHKLSSDHEQNTVYVNIAIITSKK